MVRPRNCRVHLFVRWVEIRPGFSIAARLNDKAEPLVGTESVSCLLLLSAAETPECFREYEIAQAFSGLFR